MRKKRPWHTELSSLVITLSADESHAAAAIEAIEAHSAVTTAARIGRYLPLTLESTDARPIHEWIEALPGVDYVDVVFCTTSASSQTEALHT